MFSIPILFIVFNRPETTAQVFSAIRQAQPRCLFIAADGPRDSVVTDRDRCMETKKIVSAVDWDCDVKTLFQEKNLGCRFGPSSAITWFFENVDQGIILEDDCLPDQSFFPYCEELLNRYRNDNRIFSINGSNLAYPGCEFSYSFSQFMNMWGWATWKRVANLIDYDLMYWKKMKFRKLWLYRKLNTNNWFDLDINWIRYWDDRIKWLLDGFATWDYQWVYHQLRYGTYSIVPGRNMVTNIGFGDNATHTLDPNYPTARIKLESMDFPLRHPAEIKNDTKYLDEVVKKIWCCEYKKESLMNILFRKLQKR